jgi:hypothetical protein
MCQVTVLFLQPSVSQYSQIISSNRNDKNARNSYSYENNDDWNDTDFLENDDIKDRDEYMEQNWDNMYHETKFFRVLDLSLF